MTSRQLIAWLEPQITSCLSSSLATPIISLHHTYSHEKESSGHHLRTWAHKFIFPAKDERNFVGRGGALVETTTFDRWVVGSTPGLDATWGPWGSSLPAVACALRRETPIQYPCCSRERL